MVKARLSPSRQSLLALDALNVCLADVRDGLGPYLAIYLATRHWDAGRIGIAMSAMGVATVVAQTPAGAYIDKTRRKRLALIAASLAVSLGAIAMAWRPTFPVILGAQTLIGVSAAIFPPAIASISLGLVGHALLARRTGRNEGFNHAGNVAAAVLAGAIGGSIVYEGIFYLVAAMGAAAITSTLFIRPAEIDYERARGAETADPAPHDGAMFDRDLDRGTISVPRIASIGELLEDRRILIFAASVVLFHFANAAMLPLVGQKLTTARNGGAAVSMSACIIAAQLVMVPVAFFASRLAETRGRRAVFLVGFAVLPVRGVLYTLTSNPFGLVAVQLLDGIGAGIFGVVGVLVIADLTRGTGRFNLMQGALATATGIGAALSNLMTGFVVKAAGYNVGFLTLSAIAGSAFLFYAFAMPETHGPSCAASKEPKENASYPPSQRRLPTSTTLLL